MARTRLFASTPVRLALVAVAAVLALLAVLIGWTYSETNAVLTRQVARAIAADLAGLADDFDRAGRAGVIAAIEERRLADRDGLYLLLASRSGPRIAGNVAYVASEHEGRTDGYVFRFRPSAAQAGNEHLAAATQRPLPDGSVLIVGRDIQEQLSYISRLRYILFGGIVAVAVLGLSGGLLISRHILQRIDAMTRASRAIMAGNLAGRIPSRGVDDELDRLAASLNVMLDRIERLMTGLREVSDNIAHDLKTPLNRLRNRAEAALREDRGSAAWREGLEQTIEDADELIKTFNALLLIAKLEAGAIEESLEAVDLAEVTKDVVELYEPAAEEAGFRLDCGPMTAAPIRANRQLAGQAIANLIDNAIKYAAVSARGNPQANCISIAVDVREKQAEVSVADRGPGIAPADQERVLRRFVRLEESRSRPGTGLGLSLATAVAQMHGGSLRLENNEPGLRAVLAFPLDTSRRSRPSTIAAPKPARSVSA